MRTVPPAVRSAALCGAPQTRAILAATMDGLLYSSLKDSTMIEKSASVHWEGPGKKGLG